VEDEPPEISFFSFKKKFGEEKIKKKAKKGFLVE